MVQNYTLVLLGPEIQWLDVSVNGIKHFANGPNLPYKYDKYEVKAVVDSAERHLYIIGNDNNIVKFDIKNSTWSDLPPVNKKSTSPFMINNKLFIVGGYSNKDTNVQHDTKILCMDLLQSKWEECGPALPRQVSLNIFYSFAN